VIIRDATAEDAPALAAIYGHHVLHGLGTFEETPPGAREMASRLEAVRDRGLPYIVAEAPEGVLGFAYASPFRPRAAYRHTAEDSVYVAHGQAGNGVGKALLQAVIDRCDLLGVRQMVAIIGDSGNAGSIGLHRSLGFEIKGVMPGLGFKHGRWVDIVWMQRSLNGGAAEPPSGGGIDLVGG
jgi:phosphinothricin acetyltransferase